MTSIKFTTNRRGVGSQLVQELRLFFSVSEDDVLHLRISMQLAIRYRNLSTSTSNPRDGAYTDVNKAPHRRLVQAQNGKHNV